MKKLFATIIAAIFLAFAAEANDCTVDAVDGKNYGCNDSCGNPEVQSGFWVFRTYPNMSTCVTHWWNDYWDDEETRYCGGWDTRCSKAGMEQDADLGARCWKCKCPAGQYFKGNSDGSVNFDVCKGCNGISETVQGNICWDIICPSKTSGDLTYGMTFGKDAIIWNGKCLPVCDLQTAGAVYNKSDSTYISIKFKTVNAGKIGTGATTTTSSQ
ncbi:MAG: hypothetical protein LBK26_01550 [Rickettsiales bacterium]|jgi:hypothetical protein|nr:hypothetical protein [Rickettsiales bacterium]